MIRLAIGCGGAGPGQGSCTRHSGCHGPLTCGRTGISCTTFHVVSVIKPTDLSLFFLWLVFFPPTHTQSCDSHGSCPWFRKQLSKDRQTDIQCIVGRRIRNYNWQGSRGDIWKTVFHFMIFFPLTAPQSQSDSFFLLLFFSMSCLFFFPFFPEHTLSCIPAQVASGAQATPPVSKSSAPMTLTMMSPTPARLLRSHQSP